MKKILRLIPYSIITSLSVPIFLPTLNNERTIYYFAQESNKQYPLHQYNDDKTEIKKIGYYKHPNTNKITIRPIPYYVKKVATELPTEIESLYRAFAYRYSHHDSITGFENWDTKNVKDMSYVFFENHIINTDLSAWKTDNVTNMTGMFKNATKFNNGDKSLSWTTNNVESMESMFDGAESFKQNLMSWNVEKVTKNKNFSRASGIFEYIDKKPKWKNSNEENDPVIKKEENTTPRVIIHPTPTPKPKVTLPLAKIINRTNETKPTLKPNSGQELPKSNITTSKQENKKLSTPAIVGIVVGSQVVLTSLAAGIPYLIKRFKK
ncbi:DUF285 domain-containing protein [Mycoplasma mycoides subsp. capri]|uniref:BspA family leucine-rich repeat surface protein n=1 Tax=Mycoplasma mycoides TaxID=2102 RepID=UPI0022407361|nr:BspA family leucine-rich repeat surface protein [Mycoplasma mycoides]QVJ96440.1 DUF285 domain-containing protein [Mycoplasma mycoides subsp. capri]QVJ97332.1 DUF285 domain-containing protein [Mycoplasma mycoides subsp. capri]QVK00321.1 DUF285 domain-containing protein [Mycoplasma mycoides subsp. capri]QVK01205.1 DUF285 domain-containing protein [Mycoplasma mycoides subsp. capri]